jgi:hypothetical protein
MSTQPNSWPWFSFEVRATVAPDPQVALGDVLTGILENPPFWVASVEPRVDLGVLPTPRSKVRTVKIAKPTGDSVRAALARPRTGTLTGGGVMYSEEDPPAAWMDVGMGTSFVGTFHCAGSGNLAGDERFGDAALEAAVRLVGAAGEVRWGCGWFGWYSSPPLAAGIGLVPEPGLTLGYSWLMCLPPAVVDALGGVEVVRAGPASEVREVSTASGQRCVLTLLRRSPAAVTEDLLREWRAFLAPVTPADALSRRREAFERLGIGPDSLWRSLPPMVLAEDWPPLSGAAG